MSFTIIRIFFGELGDKKTGHYTQNTGRQENNPLPKPEFAEKPRIKRKLSFKRLLSCKSSKKCLIRRIYTHALNTSLKNLGNSK